MPSDIPSNALKTGYYTKGKSPSLIHVEDWGRTNYAHACQKQLSHVEDRLQGKLPDTLIFTEHDAVYTVGRRKDAQKNLVWNAQQLQVHGIALEPTNRGGDITYHGPGQIVGYPIINLQHRKDLHRYLRDLEQCLIHTLRHFGLFATRRSGMTGIWMETRKIAAIGIAVKQWVTYHGFALNVNPKLEHFSGIIPCGITDGTVTSMEAELGYTPDFPTLKHLLEVEFKGIFDNYPEPC